MSTAAERAQKRKSKQTDSPEEARARQVRYQRARNRAFAELARLHPEQFKRLFADELEYAQLEDEEAAELAAKTATISIAQSA